MKHQKEDIDYDALMQSLKASKGYLIFAVHDSSCKDCNHEEGILLNNSCILINGGNMKSNTTINGICTIETALLLRNFLKDEEMIAHMISVINHSVITMYNPGMKEPL